MMIIVTHPTTGREKLVPTVSDLGRHVYTGIIPKGLPQEPLNVHFPTFRDTDDFKGTLFFTELSPLDVLPRVYRSCPIESHYDFPVHSPARKKRLPTANKQCSISSSFIILMEKAVQRYLKQLLFYFKKVLFKKNRFMRVILLCNAPHQ